MHRIAVSVLVVLAITGVAAAYIDPAAGSIALQLLLGGIAGIGVALKLSYRRLLELFRRGRADATAPPGESVGEPR